MGKFKESETSIYKSDASNSHFVQPTFVGLIEILKNLKHEAETEPAQGREFYEEQMLACQ